MKIASNPKDLSQWLTLGTCAVIVVSFYAPFMWMLNQWFVVEAYSPGPAVPILASIAFLHVLKKRNALPPIPTRTARRVLTILAFLAVIVYVGKEHSRLLPGSRFLSSASYVILFAATTFALLQSGFLLAKTTAGNPGRRAAALGMTLVLGSLALHFLALRGDEPRLCIVAYISLLFGLSWFLHGWHTVKPVIFPYAMLFFMVPMEFIDEIAGVPMRLLVTNVAVFLMRMVGLDVTQAGNWFAIGSMEFRVDAPCSGLKSLISLTALGATFAFVTQRTTLKKLLLGACAIPIALVTNVVRLACVGIFAQLIGMNFAVKVFHEHAAVVLYILAILIFMSLDKKVFQAQWFRVKNF
jgi:exosortase